MGPVRPVWRLGAAMTASEFGKAFRRNAARGTTSLAMVPQPQRRVSTHEGQGCGAQAFKPQAPQVKTGACGAAAKGPDDQLEGGGVGMPGTVPVRASSVAMSLSFRLVFWLIRVNTRNARSALIL